jgi:GT2 family glycosyltransferase
MQLSVVIVNYNVKYFLEHCLLSVIKACNGIEAEILVVDNNSTDNSTSYFKDKFPTVKFYWLKENIGFGRANNYALQFVNGEHVLFLNPDTIVAENIFKDCLVFFNSYKDCGALGVRMIDGTGNFLKESKRGFPFLSVAFYKAVGLANIFPRVFGQYYATQIQEEECKKVDVLAGAFMMVHTKAINSTKGFDEEFFMYGEDIDWSYRIKKAGFENYYLGKNPIIHFKGESSSKKSDAYFDNFYGGMKLFADKHSSQNKFIKNIIFLGVNLLKFFARLKNN